MVYCTAAAEVWNTCSIWGMAGRYMSIETGAKACNIPSRNRSSRCRNREMGAVCCASTAEVISVPVRVISLGYSPLVFYAPRQLFHSQRHRCRTHLFEDCL